MLLLLMLYKAILSIDAFFLEEVRRKPKTVRGISLKLY